MTLILPAEFSQVDLIFTGAPVPTGAEVTFAVGNALDHTPSAIATAVSTAWVARIKPYTDSNMSLATIHVKNGPTATGPSIDAAGPGAGSAANSSVAPNTAVLIRKNTGYGGRAGTGRMFYPGVDEAWIDEGGVIGGATLTALQTAWTNFFDDLDTAGYPMALLHSSTDPFLTPTFLTGLAVQGTVATQRRRLRR